MIGLYPPSVVQRYIQETAGIQSGTYIYQRSLGKFPAATTRGPGGKLYYTEKEYRRIIAFWTEDYKRYQKQ